GMRLYSVFFCTVEIPRKLTLFPSTTLFRAEKSLRSALPRPHGDGRRRGQEPRHHACRRAGPEVWLLAFPHRFNTRAGRGHALCRDRKSTRLNSSHVKISYAVFCLKKKNSNY